MSWTLFQTDERAVTPIIGNILMVALVVILVAVISTVVISLVFGDLEMINRVSSAILDRV